MTRANQHPPLMRSGAVVLMATLLTGCMIWEPVPLTPQVIDDSASSVIRVTLLDGQRVNVTEPYIFGDSLFGDTPYFFGDSLIGGKYEYGRGLRRVAFHLQEIAAVETSEIDGSGTATVVIGTIFAIAGLASSIINSEPTRQELPSTGRFATDSRHP